MRVTPAVGLRFSGVPGFFGGGFKRPFALSFPKRVKSACAVFGSLPRSKPWQDVFFGSLSGASSA